MKFYEEFSRKSMNFRGLFSFRCFLQFSVSENWEICFSPTTATPQASFLVQYLSCKNAPSFERTSARIAFFCISTTALQDLIHYNRVIIIIKSPQISQSYRLLCLRPWKLTETDVLRKGNKLTFNAYFIFPN